MNYTIKEISDKIGVSARTLRYYDELGLLKPNDIKLSGYRIYTDHEVEKLYIILAYKEVGYNLKEIKKFIALSHNEEIPLLYDTIEKLNKKREKISVLLKNIEELIGK